jgi:hydroxyacylglutathione hydrolase
MQISPTVHILRIPFNIPHPSGIRLERFVYLYLIVVGSKVVLIDAGVAGSEKAVYAYLLSIGRQRGSIAWILHTHAHPDHIGALRSIHTGTGCKVAIHPFERPWLEDVERQFAERPVPGFHSLVGGSVSVDRDVQEGDLIPLGKNLHLQVLHTPGHSRGSISFLLLEEGVLFTGDLIPRPGEMPIYENPVETITSLQRIGKIPGIRVLLSSWDEPRFGEEVYPTITRGIEYVVNVHCAVWAVKNENPDVEIPEFTRKTLEILKLPSTAINPLIINTITGHLKMESLPVPELSDISVSGMNDRPPDGELRKKNGDKNEG